jgi:hypothetical protein
MKKTFWVKEEQREGRHSLVIGYKRQSNFSQAELASVSQLSFHLVY